MISARRANARVLSALLAGVVLTACTAPPEEDTDLSMSTRSRMILQEVCLAYDDLRARTGEIADPERQAIHARADAACEELAERGTW